MPRPPLRALHEAMRSLLGPIRRVRRGSESNSALSRRLASITSRAPADELAEPGQDASQAPSAASPWRGIPRPSLFVSAIIAVALAAVFVAALSYYGARKFTRDAADTRASEEAHSLAASSAYNATGDAFNGYLQMLGYADDPVIASPAASAQQRRETLERIISLNTNKIGALAIVSLDGIQVYASTDPGIIDLRDSEAINRTRASLGPTNSDIVLPEGATRGYVEFTTPLREPDGHVWAVLYGRADPDKLWAATLRASVDGSRNVILNSEGLFAAGVPEEMLRLPWRGAPLENGSVAANILGADSICGLGPIGRGSQIDHGWHVASCLPSSLIQVEANRALGQQALLTSAGAVLAVVLAAGALRFVFDGGAPASASTAADSIPPADAVDESAPAEQPEIAPETPPLSPALDGAPEQPAGPHSEPSITVVADVEAMQLIGAFERRAARLSERLRGSVQARLMIAQTQAAEAFRLAAASPIRAQELHDQAIDELEAVRDGELRALAQELHPGLVRLGLPAALRSMAKELAATMPVDLHIDPACDAVPGGGRLAIDADRRLVIFRAARGALDALRAYGAARCSLALDRDGDWLHLRIAAGAAAAPDESLSTADAIAFEAYGGHLAWSVEDDAVTFTAPLPAPTVVSDGPETPIEMDEPDESAAPSPVHVFAAPLDAAGESLAASLAELAHELAGEIVLTVDIDDAAAAPGVLPGEVSGDLRMLAGVAARTMAAVGATACSVRLRIEADRAVMTLQAPSALPELPENNFDLCRQSIEALGGTLTIGADGGRTTVTAWAPATATAEAPPAVVQIDPRTAQDAA